MSAPRRYLLLLLVAAAGALTGLSGCAEGAARVSGTVKIDGQPPKVTGIEIVFAADDGRLVTAAVQADGTYQAPAVPTGKVKVGFAFIVAQPAQEPESRAMHLPAAKKPARTNKREAIQNPIPAAYREAGTSQLVCTVQANRDNVFDCNLLP